jgi:type IV pilus assembly protein PilA
MRAYKRYSRQRGFTLVELLVVIAIIGILGVLATYGYFALFGTAKSAEARQMVGAISKAAQASYARAKGPSELLAPGGTSQPMSNVLCGTAQDVPTSGPPGKKKYQPSDTADFRSGNAAAGWVCLGFDITDPIQYQYRYTKDGSPVSGLAIPSGKGFEAAAVGDVDEDGTQSKFALTGYVHTDGSLIRATQMDVKDESE